MLPLYLALVLLAVHVAAGKQHVRAVLDAESNVIVGSIPFADIDIAYTLYDVPLQDGQKAKDVQTAVFLHGMKFTKETWVELGTLEKVRQAGVRALAVDLPGHGKTPALPYSDNNMRSELLKTVLTFASTAPNSTLHLISPSMSGRYAVPFLDRHGTMLTSWVAVAPVSVSDWGGPWEDTHNKVCMMAIYGENDPMRRDMDVLHKVFRNAFQSTIIDAGHACYVDQPELFHEKLLRFLRKCKRGPTGEHVVIPNVEL